MEEMTVKKGENKEVSKINRHRKERNIEKSKIKRRK